MPRGRNTGPLMSTEEMLRKFNEGIKGQVARPNIYAYKPHKKQYMFHQSDRHTRLYIGGNRSGKTVGGGAETVYWLTKKHPYRRIPLPEGPVRMRGVAVDFLYGVNKIMLPEVTRWLPPSYYKNGSFEDSYDKAERTLTLANGSFIEFKSYEQEIEKFAGTSRHATWFDEEPPQHIYNECMARHVDTDGYTWITMTPVEGMTWVYEGLYLPGIEGRDSDIDVIEIETTENMHLSPEAIDRFLKGLSEDERKARQRGEFVAFGGRVFKDFNVTDHVIEPISLETFSEWETYVSFDHGFNNPTAVLWHAVSPQNQVVTFHEHYQNEMTIDEHAKVYHAFNKSWGREPDYVVGDPAMQQRQAVTGTSIVQEYADREVYIAPASNDVHSGINRMVQYLRGTDKIPQWHITSDCVNLIWEMKKLRWQTHASRKAQFEKNKVEQIHKKDDHACDSARYFFSFMPDLTPDPKDPGVVALQDAIAKHSNVIGAVPPAPVVGSWDQLVSKEPNVTWETEIGEVW